MDGGFLMKTNRDEAQGLGEGVGGVTAAPALPRRYWTGHPLRADWTSDGRSRRNSIWSTDLCGAILLAGQTLHLHYLMEDAIGRHHVVKDVVGLH